MIRFTLCAFFFSERSIYFDTLCPLLASYSHKTSLWSHVERTAVVLDQPGFHAEFPLTTIALFRFAVDSSLRFSLSTEKDQ